MKVVDFNELYILCHVASFGMVKCFW